MAGELSGILPVDKPEGWTSHDAAAKLRRITGQRRIGHSGTLDPMATGLLVMFVGRATRAVEFAESDEKEYLAALRPGIRTDTLDITGTVLETRDAIITAGELETVLQRFRGDILQVPPMYSAIKQNGRKLCDVARRGGEVERKPRAVTIHELTLMGQRQGDFLLRVRCSKGTYIRSLCDDIGRELGCGACLSELRRTAAGSFRVEDAHSLAEIEERGAEAFILPVDTLFADRPSIYATPAEERRIRVGADYACTEPEGEYRVYGQDGGFLMLGRVGDGVMATIKSFFEV